MAETEKVKISELDDIGTSLEGFYTVGVKEVNGTPVSKKASLEFVKTSADNADAKATLANNAANLANTKATLADTAASNANAKATLADNAASNADTKAALADTKAQLANTKAQLADTKAQLADEKATKADEAADDAIAAAATATAAHINKQDNNATRLTAWQTLYGNFDLSNCAISDLSTFINYVLTQQDQGVYTSEAPFLGVMLPVKAYTSSDPNNLIALAWCWGGECYGKKWSNGEVVHHGIIEAYNPDFNFDYNHDFLI